MHIMYLIVFIRPHNYTAETRLEKYTAERSALIAAHARRIVSS